ncbi:MAG TPA: MFS transporter [archaeon]|nr:MFS transporter [archaeon]
MQSKSAKLSEKQTARGMKYIMADGASNAAKDSVLTSYLTPLALALGASNQQIGFLNSFPYLFGNLIQPVAGKYIETRGGKKSTTLVMQFFAPILILLMAFLPISAVADKVFYLIIFTTFYQIIYGFQSTAWISWIADIVPEKTRGEFFGKRNTIAGFVSLGVSFVAGWLLSATRGNFGFTIIFGFAALAGVVSYFLLRQVPKSPQGPQGSFNLRVKEFFRDFRSHKNFSNFTYYIFFLNFGVFIASPFFVVYMLKDLGIGYFGYAVLIAAEAVVAIFSQKYWGKLMDRFGDRTILGVCGILISLVPIAFIFTGNFFTLLFAQALAGFAWAGFDLARFNFLIDATPPQKRPSFIANHKLLGGFAIFAGGLVGGFLAGAFSGVEFFFLEGLKILFALAFVFRILPLIIFLPRLREQRVPASQAAPVKNIFWRAIAVYPTQGILHELMYIGHLERDFIKKGRKIYRNFTDRFGRKNKLY